jgi:hypothetical protein
LITVHTGAETIQGGNYSRAETIRGHTVFVAGFSEIDKRGGFYKASSWENFLKKNKKESSLYGRYMANIQKY